MEDKELLRFVRNCGRMLEMQVVSAGTATVVANLVAPVSQPDVSRQDPRESFRLAVCSFMWKPMTVKAVKDALLRFESMATEELQAVLSKERPLLVHTFLQVFAENNILESLERVGARLCEQKNLFSNIGLKTMWLSGAWLADRKGWSTSPHNIKAPDLVRGHYFEPAIVALDNRMPRLQGGISRIANVPGPLIATVYHIASSDTTTATLVTTAATTKRPLWVLSTEFPAGSKAPISATATDFGAVHAALSSCVQQCLAREPLLAIAMSTQHRLSENEFKQGITECFQASHAEHCLDSMSVEQLELVVFAALQLANGANIHEPLKVPDFCKNLLKYLAPNACGEQVMVADHIVSKLQIPSIAYLPMKHTVEETQYESSIAQGEMASRRKEVNANIRKSNGNLKEGKTPRPEDHSPIPTVHSAKEMALETTIPWLVPSCLKEKYESSLPGLQRHFDDMNIAALVPGLCDIDAYQWPPSGDGSNNLLWKFEVKGRSTNYPMSDGVKDLVKKCGDHGHTDGLHHAMLIAVRGQWGSETCIWLVEKNNVKYLRVVLLLSGL